MLTNNAADNLLSFYYNGANRLQFDLTNQWFNSGNVGIGTTSPGAALQISGQNSTGTGLPNRVAYFAAAATNTNDAGVVIGSQNGNAPYIAASKLGSGSATSLGFWTNDTVRQTIDTNGNVGIGTTAPTTLLELRGNSDAGARIGVIATSGNQNSGLQLVNNARSWLLQTQGSDSNKLYIADQTAAMARMVIDTNGNVGYVSTGQFQINFTNPMSSAYYVVNGSCQTDNVTAYYNDTNEAVFAIPKKGMVKWGRALLATHRHH